jgi:hypothetical protein
MDYNMTRENVLIEKTTTTFESIVQIFEKKNVIIINNKKCHNTF